MESRNTGKINKIFTAYTKAVRRLILLDYDGTLVPFKKDLLEAKPPLHLINNLQQLASILQNKLVLISGRDKTTMENWFGKLKIMLVAEHGAWVKDRRWRKTIKVNTGWKNIVRPALEVLVEEIKGSSIEEKKFSLAWHYRNAEKKINKKFSDEIIDSLSIIADKLKLDLLPGNKVMEIKIHGVSKGAFYTGFLAQEPWDFILAIGDDLTDESLFAAIPKSAYSIKVGLAPSQARYRLKKREDVLRLLAKLSRITYL